MIAESKWETPLYNGNEQQNLCNCNGQQSKVTEMNSEAL